MANVQRSDGNDADDAVDADVSRFDDLEFLEAVQVEEASYVGPLPAAPAPSRPDPDEPSAEITILSVAPLGPPPPPPAHWAERPEASREITLVSVPPPPPAHADLEVSLVAPEPAARLEVTLVAPRPEPAPKLEVTVVAAAPSPEPAPAPKLEVTVVAVAPSPEPTPAPELRHTLIASSSPASDAPVTPSRRATPISPIAVLGSPPQRRLVEVPRETPEGPAVRPLPIAVVPQPEPAPTPTPRSTPQPTKTEIAIEVKAPAVIDPQTPVTIKRAQSVLPLPADLAGPAIAGADTEDGELEWVASRPRWPWLLVAVGAVAAMAIAVPLVRSANTESVRAAGLVVDAETLRASVPAPALDPTVHATATPTEDTTLAASSPEPSVDVASVALGSVPQSSGRTPDERPSIRRKRSRATAPSVVTPELTAAPTPTPEPAPKPVAPPSRKPAPTARALLEQGQRALQAGRADEAYRLAIESHTRTPSKASRKLIARAGCRAEHKSEARKAVRGLPLRERVAVRRDCRRSGHRLGL